MASIVVWVAVLLELLVVVISDPDPRPESDQDNPRCAESRDKGTPCAQDGAAPAKQFYYNQLKGTCQPFIYQGCGGNLNRFETAAECRKECAGKQVGTRGAQQQDWVLAERCNGAHHLVPDGRYIECAADGDAKCPEGHECNTNGTASEAGGGNSAGGVCCPSKELVCSLQDDSGTFAEGVPDKPRFAWSADIKSCWRFSYFGAKGNYNNFPSFQDCLNFCNGSKPKRP